MFQQYVVKWKSLAELTPERQEGPGTLVVSFLSFLEEEVAEVDQQFARHFGLLGLLVAQEFRRSQIEILYLYVRPSELRDHLLPGHVLDERVVRIPEGAVFTLEIACDSRENLAKLGLI